MGKQHEWSRRWQASSGAGQSGQNPAGGFGKAFTFGNFSGRSFTADAASMSTVLSILLKAPTPEAAKTRLAATLGAAPAAAVYRIMVERQIRDLPPEIPATIYFDPPDAGAAMRKWLAPLRPAQAPLTFRVQPSGDLGVRIAYAFAAEFALGASAMIVLGGDCPALDAAMLRRATAALDTHDAVLGPASDGGYYLLGLRKHAPQVFAGIDWSTPSVLQQTRARLKAAGLKTFELPLLDDVDDEPALRHAVRSGLI